MDITSALDALGAHQGVLTEQNRNDLDEKGYAVLQDMPSTTSGSQRLRTRFEELCEKEGVHAGIEVHQEQGTRRLSDLCNKGPVFDRVYTHPKVLAAIHHVIDRPFKLSSLNARDALPGEGLQGLHADWGADYDGQFHVCNSIWLLDDFSEGKRLHSAGARLAQGPAPEQNPNRRAGTSSRRRAAYCPGRYGRRL